MKLPIVLAVLAMVVATGCAKVASSEQMLAAPSEPGDPMAIVPTASVREHFKIGQVRSQPVGEVLEVAARVEVDGTRATRIGSPVMGRITALFAQEGQRVDAGQVLALVSSTLLADSQLAYLKALSQGTVAQRAVERAKALLKSEVIGEAELQRREAELSESNAARDASRDQLLQLGMTASSVDELASTRRIHSTSEIVASMPGTVLLRPATLGQVVQPADPVFEIADLSSLWLVADVPTADAESLFVGQVVQAEIGAAPIKVAGRLSFVGSTVNDATRTVRVRMQLENPNGRFKPSMLATMHLHGKTEMKPCVPLSAIVREDDREHIFVESDLGVLILKPVELGAQRGDCRVVLNGVESGRNIVTKGAFHLNNERLRRAVRRDGAQ